MRRARALGVIAGLLLAGCGGGTDKATAPSPADVPRSVVVSSIAFADGDPIPAAFTCDGTGSWPPLDWHGLPDQTRAVAMVVDDPDAPGGTYVHWVVEDIPVDLLGFPSQRKPLHATELRASDGVGWSPPCPPSGTHHYRFTIYALSSKLGLTTSASLSEIMDAIASKAIAWGRLTGTVSASGGDSGGGY